MQRTARQIDQLPGEVVVNRAIIFPSQLHTQVADCGYLHTWQVHGCTRVKIRITSARMEKCEGSPRDT